jgi:hypothetical protein
MSKEFSPENYFPNSIDGYWPKYFPIEPRPNYPLYAWAIAEYLKGNRQALEDYILMCIAG